MFVSECCIEELQEAHFRWTVKRYKVERHAGKLVDRRRQKNNESDPGSPCENGEFATLSAKKNESKKADAADVADVTYVYVCQRRAVQTTDGKACTDTGTNSSTRDCATAAGMVCLTSQSQAKQVSVTVLEGIHNIIPFRCGLEH